MMKEAKELKILSTRIYHKALDKKFPIYYLKLKDISRKLNEESSKDILLLSQEGNAYFREAKTMLNIPGGLNIEAYEKAGTIKRTGIEKQEKALTLYTQMDNEEVREDVSDNKNKVEGVVQKSYAEIHKGNDVVERVFKKAEEKNKVEVNKKTIKEEEVEEPKEEGVFKIQIGVFRNPPDQTALNKLPLISSEELKGRGLTKYFAGSFKTYDEAQKNYTRKL